MNHIGSIFAMAVCLAMSAYFSATETAFSSLNKTRLKVLADNGNKRAALALKLAENYDRLISTILIGNNIVNIMVASIGTLLFVGLYGDMGATISTVVVTVVVLIFGEITPKTYATINNTKIALSYASSIYLVTKLLTPIVYLINKLSTGILMIFHIDSKQSKRIMTERELRTIVDVSHEDGVIEEAEKDMLNNVFDFKESLAKDIMIPRIDVTFVSVDASYEEVLEIFREAGYSRLPVYEGSKDHVVGIVYFKDVYFYRSQHRGEIFHLRDVLRKPFFTYETQKVSSLLAQMREKSVSFSIVLDEYGVTAGLITLEDIVEEIFGELRDEYDESEEDTFKELPDGSYMVSASLKLDDLDDLLHVNLDSEDYDSLGGYIIELLDHLPSEGEIAEDEHFTFKVVSVDKNRMETIHIIPKENSNHISQN